MRDPAWRIQVNFRRRLWEVLNGLNRSNSSLDILGCTPEYWKEYLEDQFRDGMTWENYGKIWEIDHIVEIREHDCSDVEQLKAAFNYKNTQPLLIEEHREKTQKHYSETWQMSILTV